VIVIALTAVSSFVVPSQADAGAILRFILLILAGVMGGYGITMGLLAVLVHLASLKSFGFPYLSPVAPVQFADLKDGLIRAPLWVMLNRPRGMARDKKRQKDVMPGLAVPEDDQMNRNYRGT
jgi:spore germination protein KA